MEQFTKLMQVEVFARYVLVNGVSLLSLKGMDELITYKMSVNMDNLICMTMKEETIDFEFAIMKGDTVEIKDCPRDKISIKMVYDGMRM